MYQNSMCNEYKNIDSFGIYIYLENVNYDSDMFLNTFTKDWIYLYSG